MSKQINLQEIANQTINNTHEGMVISCMKEAIKQALELAAENARIKYPQEYFYHQQFMRVDKKSILDIINQVV